MTSLSKLFKTHLKYATCSELNHSEMESCIKSFMCAIKTYPISNMKLYFPILLSSLIMNFKDLNSKTILYDIFKQYLIFTTSGTAYGLGCKLTVCLFRNIIGRFYFISGYFLPSIIPFYIVVYNMLPGKILRLTNITSFEILMDIFLRSNIDPISRLLNRSIIFRIFVFMVCSSYIIRNLPQQTSKIFWFIKPLSKFDENVKESNGATTKYGENIKIVECIHKGTCYKYIFDGIKFYGTIGLILDFLNQILNSKNIKEFINTFMKNLKTLDFKALKFLITSITIFRTTNCLLNQKNSIGNSLTTRNTIAGFLSGFGYIFKPKLFLLSYAIACCIEIGWKNYQNKKSTRKYEKTLKNINWHKYLPILTFPLAIHTYIFDIERVGLIGQKFVEGSTDNAIKRVHENLIKLTAAYQ